MAIEGSNGQRSCKVDKVLYLIVGSDGHVTCLCSNSDMMPLGVVDGPCEGPIAHTQKAVMINAQHSMCETSTCVVQIYMAIGIKMNRVID